MCHLNRCEMSFTSAEIQYFGLCTKPKVKDAKTNRKHRNSTDRTDLPLLRLAFNENDRSRTNISM